MEDAEEKARLDAYWNRNRIEKQKVEKMKLDYADLQQAHLNLKEENANLVLDKELMAKALDRHEREIQR